MRFGKNPEFRNIQVSEHPLSACQQIKIESSSGATPMVLHITSRPLTGGGGFLGWRRRGEISSDFSKLDLNTRSFLTQISIYQPNIQNLFSCFAQILS